MPAPQVVPKSDVPEPPKMPTRTRSSYQQHVDAQVAEFADTIRELGPDQAIQFTFDASDDEGFRFTTAQATVAKDRYRRMMRKALESSEFTNDDVSIRYQFELEDLPQGEVLAKGFTAWVERE